MESSAFGDSDRRSVDQFVELLTAHQSRLYAYIYSLVGDVEVAKDTLQETNRVLWRKVGDFEQTRPFLPWALTFAQYQVRAARSRMGRERLCFCDDASLQLASEEVEERLVTPEPGERELALEACLGKLSDDQRDIVSRYYRDGMSTSEIGEGLNRRANTIAVTLHRVRVALGDCIREYLSGNPNPSKS